MARRPGKLKTAVLTHSLSRGESLSPSLLLPNLDLARFKLVVVSCWGQEVTLTQILLHTEPCNEQGTEHWQLLLTENSSGWSQPQPVLSDSHHGAGTGKDHSAKYENSHLRIQALTPPQSQTELEMLENIAGKSYEKSDSYLTASFTASVANEILFRDFVY